MITISTKDYDKECEVADNIAGLERCVKAMVVLGFVGIAAAVAFVAI